MWTGDASFSFETSLLCYIIETYQVTFCDQERDLETEKG